MNTIKGFFWGEASSVGGNNLNLVVPIAQAPDGNHTQAFRDKGVLLG